MTTDHVLYTSVFTFTVRQLVKLSILPGSRKLFLQFVGGKNVNAVMCVWLLW